MNQKCIVTNKAQLFAAVGCAFNYFGKTEIILNRKHGTTIIKLQPSRTPQDFANSYDFYRGWPVANYHKGLRKIRANIRKTPAKCFK